MKPYVYLTVVFFVACALACYHFYDKFSDRLDCTVSTQLELTKVRAKCWHMEHLLDDCLKGAKR